MFNRILDSIPENYILTLFYMSFLGPISARAVARMQPTEIMIGI